MAMSYREWKREYFDKREISSPFLLEGMADETIERVKEELAKAGYVQYVDSLTKEK